MNYSIPPIDYEFVPTNECIIWCQDRVSEIIINMSLESFVLILLAGFSLLAQNIIINFSEKIKEITGINEFDLEKAAIMAGEFALYLIIGFFVYYFWLQ